MALVALMTTSGVFQGELGLESPVGQPVRLIDALNQPHRLKRHTQRVGQLLELHRPVRRELGGRTVKCGELLGVRSSEVLVGYEVLSLGGAAESTVRSYEERQQWRGGEAGFLVLRNGFRLTGEIAGGLNMIDLADKPGRQFVLCRGVRLLASGTDTALELPFASVNAQLIEGSGLGDPWPAQAPG